jgi:hypothetical protein
LALVRHVARAIFRALDDIHDNDLVHDDISLDTIFVASHRVGWRGTFHAGLRSKLRTFWDIHNFEEGAFAPNLYLRGFALDRLLDETRALNEAHAAGAARGSRAHASERHLLGGRRPP